MSAMKQPTLDREIRSRIDAFASDLSQLIRASAVQALLGALGAEQAAPAARVPAAPASAAPVKARRGKRGKRSSEDVQKTSADLLTYITSHPGERLEQIAVGMGLPSKALKLPIQKLFEAKSIRSEGQRRGMKYFAGGKKARGRARKA